MNTQEVVTTFRVYADEPDESFMSNPEAGFYCKIGYDQFRNFVAEVAPSTLSRGTNITMTNQAAYDLTQANVIACNPGTPSLLGPNPNQDNGAGAGFPLGRMTRLISVININPTTNFPIRVFSVVSNPTAMLRTRNVCRLEGTQLTFPYNVTGTFALIHTHEQEIGLTNPVAAPQEPRWFDTTTGVINNVNIDDNLQIFHDMIPLFAMEQYGIQNAMDNAQALVKLEKRKTEFRDYLMQRTVSGVQYVHLNYDPSTDDSWGTF